MVPQLANSEKFALPSVSGSSPRSLRQAPRAWARACPRELRDPGLPFRPLPGHRRMSRAPDNKKPSGAAGSGGSVTDGLSISPQARSLPSAGHALSIGQRPRGIVMRCSSPYLIVWLMPLGRERNAREGGGHTPWIFECQDQERSEIATARRYCRCNLWMLCPADMIVIP